MNKFLIFLENATCPSLNCVRKFITMLQDTVFDYDKDISIFFSV